MRIKEIREDNDIKQETIAKYLGVTQATYSRYENSERQIPLNLLINIANYYNTSLDYLVGITNEKNHTQEYGNKKILLKNTIEQAYIYNIYIIYIL